MNIHLSHNPFLIETDIKIDGVILPSNHKLIEDLNGRLQLWVDKLFSIISSVLNNPCDIEMVFQGLETDFDDIRKAAEVAEENSAIKINLQHVKVKSPDERLQALDLLMHDAHNGEIRFLLGENLDKITSAYSETINPDFEVNVIATMSSGKSTIINSMLGMDLLPTKNEACTATIAKIYDEDNLGNDFEAESFDGSNNLISERQPVNSKVISNWNAAGNSSDGSKVSYIKIYGDIPAIKQHQHSRLVLVDTPGPNNSQNQEHGIITHRAIASKKMPMVVYVINATQIGVNDDKELLSAVKESIKELSGKQARDRFIFLLNKFDELKVDKDGENGSFNCVLDKVKKYLSDVIENPIVIPVSAECTLLNRLHNEGKLSNDDDKDRLELLIKKYNRTYFQSLEYMEVSPAVKRRVKDMIASAKELDDEKELASIHSGIPILECVIDEYLTKYALPVKINLAYGEINKHLHAIQEGQKAIEAVINSSESELIDLNEIIAVINKKIQSGDSAINFKNQVMSSKINIDGEVAEKIADIEGYFLRKLQLIANSFTGNNMAKDEADSLIKKAEREYLGFRSKSIATLENVRDDFLEEESHTLLEEYKNHIIELFDSSGTDVPLPAIEKLKIAALAMPDAKDLIKKSLKTEPVVVGTKTVSDSSWYNPFSWGRTRTVKTYEDKEFSKPKIIWDDLEVVLTRDMAELIKTIQDDMKNQVEKMRSEFFNSAEKQLEQKIADLLNSVSDLDRSKEAKEAKVKESKKNLELIAEFSARVQGALKY